MSVQLPAIYDGAHSCAVCSKPSVKTLQLAGMYIKPNSVMGAQDNIVLRSTVLQVL